MRLLVQLLQLRTHCQTLFGLVAVTSIALILINAFSIAAHFKPGEPYRLVSDSILMAYLAYTLCIFTPHGTLNNNRRLVFVYGALVTVGIILMFVIWGLQFAQVQNVEVVDWIERTLDQLQAVASLWHFKLRSFREPANVLVGGAVESNNVQQVVSNSSTLDDTDKLRC